MLGESIEKDRMAEARLGRDRLEAQERGWCHGSQDPACSSVCRREKAKTESRERQEKKRAAEGVGRGARSELPPSQGVRVKGVGRRPTRRGAKFELFC